MVIKVRSYSTKLKGCVCGIHNLAECCYRRKKINYQPKAVICQDCRTELTKVSHVTAMSIYSNIWMPNRF